jgi:hypothetical protein
VRCMNHYSHPRPLHVLRRARRSLVSTGKDPSATARASRRPAPLCDVSQLCSTLDRVHSAQHHDFLKPPHPLSIIQNT